MILRKGILSTDKILKEMTALECENARSARSHIYSTNVSVSSIYTVVYSAIPQVRGNCIAIVYMQMNVYTLNIYDSETKYIKYIDKILKEMTVSGCKNAKIF